METSEKHVKLCRVLEYGVGFMCIHIMEISIGPRSPDSPLMTKPRECEAFQS